MPASEPPAASLKRECDPALGTHVYIDITPAASAMLILAAVFFAFTRLERATACREKQEP
jgi:hypothetical protein